MEPLVEFEYLGSENNIAVARLVREKPLNSLLLETIDQLSEKIFAWLEDDSIACILLDSSSERAFCAGADITALYHSIQEAGDGPNPYAEAFFLNEYKLDYALHTAQKPVVAWGNGIVMGGGLGLLGGCSHRVGTPATRIAMPEITIGLFPDAGGTSFLSGLPDHLGLFAGLTGCQLSAGDALGLGLLDVVVDQGDKGAFLHDLAATRWVTDATGNRQAITRLLARYEHTAELPLNLLRHRQSIADLMDACLATEDFFSVFDTNVSKLPDDEWLTAAVATYRSGSATTARVFVEQMKRAGGMSLADMFRMELVIAYQCAQHPDFPEGVRALLIDKDRNPGWIYKTASAVPDAYVAEHFVPLWKGPHPLDKLGTP